MDIHPPHAPIRSIRDFLVQLLTVIIGILIALSLEGLVQQHHRQALVHEARVSLAAEIQDNQTRLKGGLDRAPEAEAALQATIAQMQLHRRDPGAPWPSFTWGFALFPLASTAWNTAASTGALAYMPYTEVAHYTRVYLRQEQFLAVQQRTLDRWLELQQWAERMGPPGHRPTLTPDQMQQVEAAAAAALMHTRTEESIATAVLTEYAAALRLLGGSREGAAVADSTAAR
jgi:hypothetical protein